MSQEPQEEVGSDAGLETHYLQHQPEVHPGGRAEAGLEKTKATAYTCSPPGKNPPVSQDVRSQHQTHLQLGLGAQA